MSNKRWIRNPLLKTKDFEILRSISCVLLVNDKEILHSGEFKLHLSEIHTCLIIL